MLSAQSSCQIHAHPNPIKMFFFRFRVFSIEKLLLLLHKFYNYFWGNGSLEWTLSFATICDLIQSNPIQWIWIESWCLKFFFQDFQNELKDKKRFCVGFLQINRSTNKAMMCVCVLSTQLCKMQKPVVLNPFNRTHNLITFVYNIEYTCGIHMWKVNGSDFWKSVCLCCAHNILTWQI